MVTVVVRVSASVYEEGSWPKAFSRSWATASSASGEVSIETFQRASRFIGQALAHGCSDQRERRVRARGLQELVGRVPSRGDPGIGCLCNQALSFVRQRRL